ncbi:hypothetical protein EVAR_25206_1 [Eumeta japonica]|uniref:Uncharacterized protein n=1 Tax=Eumeta variegata TaxID=151549 RepID=A0A4C1WJK1_EUMVA|nr:hypothetical protein EVAR_25206_1 [Eumeta japonica]
MRAFDGSANQRRATTRIAYLVLALASLSIASSSAAADGGKAPKKSGSGAHQREATAHVANSATTTAFHFRTTFP